tara:strand:+ start:2435 stop:2761 length:327 start_codon:yes stop_codon:yes gene_type:complete
MRVIVVDKNVDRHKDHEKTFKDLNVTIFQIKKSIDVNTISKLETDILLVHKNNDEFCQIESSDHFGKIRIYFSDGYVNDYIKDDHNYYVPFDQIEKTISNILLKEEKQ